MKRYSVTGAMALIAGDSVIGVHASATVRPRIYELFLGSSGTPADYSATFILQRTNTSTGTKTAATPEALDSADPAAVATAGYNYTAEPTAGNAMLRFAMNMRATPRWVAAPGSELVIPASANVGATLLCNAVSTQFTVEATVLFAE